MRFAALVSLLSLSAFALEFEVIGDFRKADEIKNWQIVNSKTLPTAFIQQKEKNAVFFSANSNGEDKLVRKGNWDFSKYSLFMADVTSDSSRYEVSLIDAAALKNGVNCKASFSAEQGKKSTVKIPVKDFVCDDQSTVDLSKIKEISLKSKEPSFELVLESFWMEQPGI